MTYRKDGTANVSPVWFRWHDDAFEVVIAHGDVKLKHLAHDPRCALLVFEAVPPGGIEVRGVPELIEGDVTPVREGIARSIPRSERRSAIRCGAHVEPGVLLRLSPVSPRVWDLRAMLAT